MSWCWTLGCVWRLLVLGGRVVGRWHRWLGVLVEGDGGRGVLSLLVLYRKWLTWLVSSDGLAHSGVGNMVVTMRLPLLGVCSQETSTPWTWSMVAKAVLGRVSLWAVMMMSCVGAAECECKESRASSSSNCAWSCSGQHGEMGAGKGKWKWRG